MSLATIFKSYQDDEGVMMKVLVKKMKCTIVLSWVPPLVKIEPGTLSGELTPWPHRHFAIGD